MIELHSLRAASRRHRPKRVGRGNATGKGTTAGRGTKGQRARTGGRNKLIRRGLKAMIERTPKTRGFRARRPPAEAISLAVLASHFDSGTVITPDLLVQAGLVRAGRPVKVLASEGIQKKLSIKAHRYSKGAKAAIEKAGGSAVEIKSSNPKT